MTNPLCVATDTGDKQLFTCDPVTVDFDGAGKPCIAVAAGKSVSVYSPDGALRWTHELPRIATHLSAGDLNGDGKQELCVGMWSWVIALTQPEAA